MSDAAQSALRQYFEVPGRGYTVAARAALRQENFELWDALKAGFIVHSGRLLRLPHLAAC